MTARIPTTHADREVAVRIAFGDEGHRPVDEIAAWLARGGGAWWLLDRLAEAHAAGRAVGVLGGVTAERERLSACVRCLDGLEPTHDPPVCDRCVLEYGAEGLDPPSRPSVEAVAAEWSVRP